MHDRLHGTDYGDGRVEQMARPTSPIATFARTTVSWPAGGPLKFSMSPSVGNDGVMSFWLNYPMPEQATRTMENLRATWIRIEGGIDQDDATSWGHRPGTT